MKNSLASKGLSMSTAQSVSNLCNQRSKDITAALTDINNASKAVVIDNVTYMDQQGNRMPKGVVEMLTEKARLHATQAFLMENIKAKDQLIKNIQQENYEYAVEMPQMPRPVVKDLPSAVNEDWGWAQLSTKEYNEFLEAESYASHIGQFIHKGGKLDRLRSELPTIKTLEFIEIEAGKRTPMIIKVHHTAAELLTLHEQLAGLHRDYEQKVNYSKAKVKNLTTLENARIAKERADIQSEVNEIMLKQNVEYKNAYSKWVDDQKQAVRDFEVTRQISIQAAANLKIEVDPIFQSTIDMFLKELK